MLTIFDHDHRLHRRAFLRIGGLTLGGLSLADLFAARAAEGRRLLSDKSVIFLFLHGGPSQIETFDPHMAAPVEFRSATGEEKTILHFPYPYGYPVKATDRWLMNHMIHNLTTITDTVWITYDIDFVRADSALGSAVLEMLPLQLLALAIAGRRGLPVDGFRYRQDDTKAALDAG